MNDDVISRHAAMSLAGDLQIHNDEYHMYNQAINNYCAEIMGLPPAPPQPHWTFIKEKLPEKEGRYLVWMPLAPPESRITVAEYCGDYWNIKTPVLAWMPLPPFNREQEVDITIKTINLQEAMK